MPANLRESNSAKIFLNVLLTVCVLAFGLSLAMPKKYSLISSVEMRRNSVRVAAKESTRLDEVKSLDFSVPSVVNANPQTVRLPLEMSRRVFISKNSSGELGSPSTVTVEPTLVLPKDAPKLPSAPSGASTIRPVNFKMKIDSTGLVPTLPN